MVAETRHFLLLAAAEPLVEGHLLLVPRDHLSCLAAFPASLDAELARLKERALQMLAETCGQAALFERGDPRSASAHAQIHALAVGQDLLPELREGRAAVAVDDLEQARAEAQRRGRYLYWESGTARAVLDDPGDAELSELDRLRATLPPSRQGRVAAQWLRGMWQRRMAAAGEPIQVVTCLLRRGERVCLLQRSLEMDSAPGRWHGVSGYLPEGQEPLHQALLEIEQETGIEPRQLRLARTVDPLTFSNPAAGRLWRIHPFLFDLMEGEPRLNWEHSSLAWILPTELGAYECIGSLPELVRRLLGPAEG